MNHKFVRYKPRWVYVVVRLTRSDEMEIKNIFGGRSGLLFFARKGRKEINKLYLFLSLD